MTPIACPTAETAIGYARWIESKGWKPTPLHVVGPDGITCSCPKGKNCGRSAGKHNIAGGWQNDHRGVAIFEEMRDGAPRFDKEGEPNGTFPPRKRMNVGVLTGDVSGIFVLDIDPNDNGFETIKALIAEHGQLPPTFAVKTGTGGYHYYFTMPDFDARNSAKKLGAGLDIRANGGMVVGPGSVSYAGYYSVANDAPVLDAPDWLLEMIRPTVAETPAPAQVDPFAAEAASGAVPESFTAAPAPTSGQQTRQQAAYEDSILTGELKTLAQLRVSGWNGAPWDITTFNVACTLIELANADWTRLTLKDAHERFLSAAPPQEPGYDPEAKWVSALGRIGDKARSAPEPRHIDPGDPFSGPNPHNADPTVGGGADREGAPAAVIGPFQNSDLGNANRLVAWCGDQVRYAADAQSWLTYDHGVWSEETGEVEAEALMKSALDLARANEGLLHSDVAHDPEAKNHKSDRTEFWKWMQASEGYAKIQAGVKMLRSDARVRVSLGSFDANPLMFNAANCAIDLSTGDAVPHSPHLLFRHQSRIAYNPNAACPLWEKFLERTQPDPAMRDWLQRVLGYTLTGRMDEQAIFIHNGPGATGKTTFLEVVNAVMGDYGQKLERETLMSKTTNNGSIPADVAAMAGARFLAASETAAGKKLDDERVKELVGGDTQRARHLYGKWFDFTPTAKIHMATNHLPGFESGGDGMGRRLRLVPWEVQIPKPEQDKTLKDRIIAQEAEGVLAWLVRGAVAWVNSTGLETPGEVERRSQEHIDEADPLKPFIDERLEVGFEYQAEFQAIYGAYTAWCDLNGNKPWSGRAFSMGLKEKLPPNSWFKDPVTRRSMFHVMVRLQAVPEYHQAYARGI